MTTLELNIRAKEKALAAKPKPKYTNKYIWDDLAPEQAEIAYQKQNAEMKVLEAKIAAYNKMAQMNFGDNWKNPFGKAY